MWIKEICIEKTSIKATINIILLKRRFSERMNSVFVLKYAKRKKKETKGNKKDKKERKIEKR